MERMNPCVELCYNRYGKQYNEECDEKCEFAYTVKQLKDLARRVEDYKQKLEDSVDDVK